MATAMPSGMLWSAMANVMPAPISGLFKAPTKVATPSGKLCTAIAMADMMPSFFMADASPVCCSMSTAAVLSARESPGAS